MRMRLTSRMRVGFAIMSVLLLASGLVSVLYTYHVQSATEKLLNNSISGLRVTEDMELAIELLRSSTTEELLSPGSPRLAEVENHKAEVRDALREARAMLRVPKQTALLQQLSAHFREYEMELDQAVNLGRDGQLVTAQDHLTRAQAAADELPVACEAFEAVNEEIADADLGQMNHSNTRMRRTMYGLWACGMLLGYLLSLAISRSIMSPIHQLVLKVRGAAGDEFVERIDIPQGTALEELDDHVRQLIERINTTRADLEHSRRLLMRSERLAALGRVSAGVAHEIRNPLTSIKMLVYSIGEDAALTEEQKKDLAVVAKEIDRMDRFVESFLKFARPPDPHLVSVDLNQMVRETLDLLTPRLRQANIRRMEIYASELQPIAADSDQLRQVVMNLILNAAEAMPAGGTLTVETRCRPAETGSGPGWIQLLVRDTGEGIPAELLDTLFDPFVSGREEGLGLGLAISHQIVEQHGGWIDAQNAPEGGATLTVSLPDRRGNDHAQSVGSGRRGERPLLVPQDPA
jgi:two-component system, NtrC family, sensor histidine kinase HydH